MDLHQPQLAQHPWQDWPHLLPDDLSTEDRRALNFWCPGVGPGGYILSSGHQVPRTVSAQQFSSSFNLHIAIAKRLGNDPSQMEAIEAWSLFFQEHLLWDCPFMWLAQLPMKCFSSTLPGHWPYVWQQASATHRECSLSWHQPMDGNGCQAMLLLCWLPLHWQVSGSRLPWNMLQMAIIWHDNSISIIAF